MRQLSAEVIARLTQLQTDVGLCDAEQQIVHTLAAAFHTGLDRLAELPPSRREWADFWEDKQHWFAEVVSRSGMDLLGPDPTPEDEKPFYPLGRLFTARVVRHLVAEKGIRASRYALTAATARRLFTDDPGTGPQLLAIALHHLARAGGTVEEEDRPKRMKGTIPEFLRTGFENPSRTARPARDPEGEGEGETTPEEALFDRRDPEIGFDEVILPAETMREIRTALVQIRKHPLLVERWGVGERYRMGRGLAFNFAGPPGTGKTLTAEAVAKELGRPLMTIKYSGLESKWIGETGKHIAAVFAAARRDDAVLFFDEADAIASRRTANMEGSGRHYNQSVNILLHELEQYEGVVIFATNLAANFDPAFERRIQSHVLFLMPEAEERERIWRAHLPPRAPLAPDVDLRRLAEDFEMAGGDIRNAMLKAVRLAALDDRPDEELCITQEHLLSGARAVLHARTVMAQSILARLGDGGS